MLKRSLPSLFTAPDENPFLAIARDPLSTLSRKNRSRLVALSGIAIGIRAANLLPTQVSALGITLSITDQVWLVRFLWISLLYLLATFVVYALLDYWTWQANLDYRLFAYLNQNEQSRVNLDEAVDDFCH